jgi:small multidrug resistance pump
VSAWIYLTIAILAEVTGTVALRYTEGFSRPLPLAIVVAGYALAFYLLARTLKDLSLGLTYAVWAGAGTALIALVGILALHEPVNAPKLIGIVLVIAGIVSLNLGGAH